MSGISNKYSERTNRTESAKPVQTVETAGSLATNSAFNYFAKNTYDSFSTNNPFAVNYADYSSVNGETVAYALFLSDFSNAVSTLSDSGATCAVVSSGCTSSSGSSGSGGFTSFC